MTSPQPGILAPVPPLSRYLEFGLVSDGDLGAALEGLVGLPVDESVVVGLGPGLVQGWGRSIAGLRPFPSLNGPACEVPATQP